MALLAEDERMLKKMMMELNERCEDYGMKININKTKAMFIGRKPKKIDIRIKGESIELVERMLKNMLMELNERCEDYEMKININKTKTMVIGRKPKKIHIRIKCESIEQVDSFKYLGCNISSNMNCCQEVKQRIAIAKEAFNRKSSNYCGPLEKRTTEETSEVLWCCMMQRPGHYDGMSKNNWKHLRCG